MFLDLGGADRVDLNFSKQNEDGSDFECPLFCAVAKGNTKMLGLMLNNKNFDINITDCDGINAFWFACYLGRGEMMHELANLGIDVLCTDA